MPLAFEAALAQLVEAHTREVNKLAQENIALRTYLVTKGIIHPEESSAHESHQSALASCFARGTSEESKHSDGPSPPDQGHHFAVPSLVPGEKTATPPLEFHPVVPSEGPPMTPILPCDVSPPAFYNVTTVSPKQFLADQPVESVSGSTSLDPSSKRSSWLGALPQHGESTLEELRRGILSKSRSSLAEAISVNSELNHLNKAMANMRGCPLPMVFAAWSRWAKLQRSTIYFEPNAHFNGDHGDADSNTLPFKPVAQLPSRTLSGLPTVGATGSILVEPGSSLRICWDLCGAILLVFDVIMVPLSAFVSFQTLSSWIAIDWIALLFWSFDMLASCLTGYIEKGQTVMQPRLIILHYLQTWFLPDIFVVCLDWASTMARLASGSPNGLFRTFRMFRMLRLLKIRRIITMARDRITSEEMVIVVDALTLLVVVLVITHFMAATWYAIGNLGADNSSWIDAHNLRDKSVGHRYSIAYHWSLTQFTPGSMEVRPYSIHERVFNNFVLVFGLVLFSSFISNITRSLTRLQDLKSESATQFWLLRRHLRQNDVPGALSWRILRCVEHAMAHQKHRAPTSKIWVLKLLSPPLQRELNFAVNFACLKQHPFFDSIDWRSHPTMMHLTEEALSEQSLATNDHVFNAGRIGTAMYMLQTGELGYYYALDGQSMSNDPTVILFDSDWACEAALWIEWSTLGALCARIESRIICVHPPSFAKVMHENNAILSFCLDYAREFAAWMSGRRFRDLTDIAKADEMSRICMTFIEDEHAERSFAEKLHRRSGLGIKVRPSLLA